MVIRNKAVTFSHLPYKRHDFDFRTYLAFLCVGVPKHRPRAVVSGFSTMSNRVSRFVFDLTT